ncbi:MAG: excinuclease ABC subunit UvrB [Candidatus Berkelbacteria bacterium]|nr:excinuclease ABC subunit UvrB [Candidatus Berkelbacteria bacterium]
MNFKLVSQYKPKGDQPQAISRLVKGLAKGKKYQTLLGVTGSGKTFTIANIIQKIQKPTLIISHNKVLAAQLCSEFKEFFPQNAVHYFVSYYDYYQPEAYLPQTDTYIEKDASINQEIDRLRHAATHSLLTRNDVIIVASVSCIYNIGSPDDYQKLHINIKRGETKILNHLIRQLTNLQYERNDFDFFRGRMRLKGDTLEIFPPYEDFTYRIEFFGNKIEKISQISEITGEKIVEIEEIEIYPAKHFITPTNKIELAINEIKEDLRKRVGQLQKEDKKLFAERLKSRTNFDIEMMKETGYCNGIENYSRYFDQRKPGEPAFTLIDFFPKDLLIVADESHITLPQIRGMYSGDRARKETLVNYGFRLPSCLDNRPLKYPEFEKKIDSIIYMSATPSLEELNKSKQVVEQIIRPTGLVDPEIEIRKTDGQINNLVSEIKKRVSNKQRVLLTTLTIRMAEELTDYLSNLGIKVAYLHHKIDTLERPEILRDLRLGIYDVVVGINLLREGLDLPEVSLVAILDADKESFLRSDTSLIQIIGRAARHVEGKVIMYADNISSSMKRAISETSRRRKIQTEYNKKHGITPQTIKKAIMAVLAPSRTKMQRDLEAEQFPISKIPPEERKRLVIELTDQMNIAAQNLEFEKAAMLRDQITKLKNGSA